MNTIIKKAKALMELGGIKKDVAFLVLGGLSLIISLFDLIPLPFDATWVAIILCGVPILMEAVIGLITAFDIKADVLVSLALIASVCIGEDFAAGEVAFIMQLGALLEELTVARARAGIEKLVKLTPRTARVLHDGQADILPAEQVRVGDLVRVLPGETIPVDGVIVSGQTSVNQAIMTGESMPVDKSAGDSVASGTVNQFGSIDLRAGRVGEDSSIQRMIRLVQTADAGKAKIVGLADRWATWIVVIALSAAVLTWLFTGQIIRAVTILVVFCPCALVLATPTAIMAAIGNATHHGFLVREGDALERLASVRRVAFDKTGTLTLGAPRVAAVHTLCPELDEAALFTLVAAAEQLSEHPLGKAIVTSWRENGAGLLPAADQFQMLPGRGVQAVVEGRTILAGNRAMLAEQGIPLPQAAARAADASLEEGCTVIYIACDNRAVGLLALSDTVRPEAHAALAEVQALGVEPVLLTGDNEKAARHLARQLGINSWHAGCLPQDKLRYMDDSLAEGQPVAMIGDGINDAPALKRAQVGIAMGGIGSDIAVEAADIALINDDLRELPHLVELSRRMMFVIRCNLTFSMALNFLAITLAITGLLNPVVGALVHNAGSVFVILHSAFLLGWRRHRTAKR